MTETSETTKQDNENSESWLIPLLACPVCTSSRLRSSEETDTEIHLLCEDCSAKFPIFQNVPLMFTSEELTSSTLSSLQESEYSYANKPLQKETSKLQKLKRFILTLSSPQLEIMHETIERYAVEHTDSTDILVDVGCSDSPYSKYFSANHVLLLDIEKRGPVHLLTDIHEPGIRSESADVVLLTEVLEHVADQRQALLQMARILKEDGLLIVSVPFLFGVHEEIDYQRWTNQGLQKLLQETGFEVLDMTPRGGIFLAIFQLIKNIPKEILGGNLQSQQARLLSPLLILHFLFCVILTPFALLLDRFDTHKFSTVGYVALCRKKRSA